MAAPPSPLATALANHYSLDASPRRVQAIAGSLLVFALGILSVSQVPQRTNTDSLQYLGLGFNFAHGAGLTIPGEIPPTGSRLAPGWPLLLAWPFGAGLSLAQVALLSSIIGAAGLGAAALFWRSIFARRVGPTWGTLAAIWPLVSYPALLVSPSAASEGISVAFVAALALWLDDDRSQLSQARQGLIVLTAGLTGLVLLRTILLTLWPAVLYQVRNRFTLKYRVLSIVLALGLLAVVFTLSAPHQPGPSYIADTILAWKSGTWDVPALLGNWVQCGWVISAFLFSPLPFSHRIFEILHAFFFEIAGWSLGLALLVIAIRQRHSGIRLPPLTFGIVLLAIPFLCGYPFNFEPRFLVPGCAPLGFLAVLPLSRLSRRTSRVAMVLLSVWLGFGAIWWLRLARHVPNQERTTMTRLTSVLNALKAHEGGTFTVCTREPLMLWAVDSATRACRLLTTIDYLASQQERNERIGRVLTQTEAACVVDVATQPNGEVDPPYGTWGYSVVTHNDTWVGWCRRSRN